MSHYRVLGVPQRAGRDEIRAAYVRAARASHPDLHRDADHTGRLAAVDRMCAINEAWRVLGDPSRRRIYDASRVRTAAGVSGVPRPASPQPTRSPSGSRPQRVPGAAPAGGRSNPIIMLPAILMALATLQMVVGLLLGVPGVLTTGAITFALSVAAFAAAPLLMLAASRTGRRSVVG